jgi:hypothetical protein
MYQRNKRKVFTGFLATFLVTALLGLATLSAYAATTMTGDIITKGPWVDSRAYSSLAVAVANANGKEVKVFTAHTLTTDLTVNSALSVEPGGSLTISNCTLSIGSGVPFKAGRHRVFTFVGSGRVVGLQNPFAEWFPLDASGLQKAIDSTSDTFGQSVSVGLGTTIDIGNSTVTLRKGTRMTGESRYLSKIVMNDGSISYGTYAEGTNRYKILENLSITNNGTTSKTIDMGDVSGVYGPYENILRNCNASGGKYVVYTNSGAATILEENYISNDVNDAARFAVYSAGTMQPTSLTLRSNRILGKVYLSGGTSPKYLAGLNSNGNIYESSYDYCLSINNAIGLNINGDYFEPWMDIPTINIGQYVYGGSIRGSYITTFYNSSTNATISIDGQGIDVSGNYIGERAYASGAGIVLGANSTTCKIGANSGALYVSNLGSTSNSVWPSGNTIYRTTTQVATNGTDSTTLLTHSLLAYVLINSGSGVILEASGTITGSAGTKVIKYAFGNNAPVDLLPAENVTGNWYAKVWTEGVDATNQKTQYALWLGTTLKSQGYITDAEDMTNSHAIGIVAQCSNGSDSVTLQMGSLRHQ